MPIRSPFYDLPEFPPTGNAQVDGSLEQWRRSFGASYTRNLFEAERIPFSVSTQGLESGAGSTLLSTVVASTTVIAKTVGFQGGEDVNVVANVYMSLGSPGVAATSFQVATVNLWVRYPDGTSVNISTAGANVSPLQASIQGGDTSIALAGSFGQTWRVPVKIQAGGLHRFALRAHKSNSSSLVACANPSLTILAF